MCCNPIYLSNYHMYVPCGKCYECQNVKRAEWAFRAKEELRDRPNAYFVTLTYNDKNLPSLVIDDDHEINVVWKPHTSEFIKSWQKYLAENYGIWNYKYYTKTLANGATYSNRVKKYSYKPLMRYYISAEYGSNNHRPHYHGLFFLPNGVDIQIDKFTALCRELWSYGNVDVQRVTRANINYVQKHQVKVDAGNLLQQIYAPIYSTMSRYNGGIGVSYLNKIKDAQLTMGRSNRLKVVNGSYKMPLPNFYMNKLFDKHTDDEFVEIATKQNQLHYSRYLNYLEQYGYYGISKKVKKYALQNSLSYNVAMSLIAPDFEPQREKVFDEKRQKFIYRFVKDTPYYSFRVFLRSKDDVYRRRYECKKHTQYLLKTRWQTKEQENYNLQL